MDIKTYALKLLKKKSYFIKELYDKLLPKYSLDEISKIIKVLIINDFINDSKLVKLKINYMVYEKKYGKNYIIYYFTNKGISLKLVIFHLNAFEKKVFLNNKDYIIKSLLSKGKNEVYINNYLRRKGYDDVFTQY